MFTSASRRMRRVVIVAAVLFTLFGGAAVAGYIYYRHRTGDIYHAHAAFTNEAPPQLPAAAPNQKNVDRFAWPLYGYTSDHQRNFPAPPSLRPPFTQVWVRGGNALLEFPPVMYGERIYQLADDGTLNAINKHTGHTFWSQRIGSLSASSPAVAGGNVYATVLKRFGSSGGRVVALEARKGAIRWSRDLPSPSESSPLFDHGRIFFGSQNGTVYALNAHNGNVVWTYHAGGAVKGSPSLKNGKLYFGDYSGHVQAISESNGRRVWVAGSGGAVLGNGEFYSTPAVVYGRVYIGNTDGRVYAYDSGSGSLDWAKQTGAYVYSSPAVADAPGLGPTIYIGSYDGRFYALDARSGRVRWSYNAGGRISGSPTVLGRIVYFADLASRRTLGLGISTGQKQFEKNSGSFDPVVSDGVRIYLTGYTGLYALQPTATLAPRKTTAAAPKPAPAKPAPPKLALTPPPGTQPPAAPAPIAVPPGPLDFKTCVNGFMGVLASDGWSVCHPSITA
jgi:outer membrane protein assembly factor BamB